MLAISDLKFNPSALFRQLGFGLLAVLSYVLVAYSVEKPKVVTGVHIEVSQDGGVTYTRTVAFSDELIFGYGEVRVPGQGDAICRGNWTHTYQDADSKTATRTIDWMLNAEEPCPLPLPVGAEWKFVWTPQNPDLDRTIKVGEVSG